MAITSVEVEAAKQAYYDNADYVAEGSVAKAKAFMSACARLLILLPASAAQGGESISISVNLLPAQQDAARKWLAINDPASTQTTPGYVRYADTRNFRR